MKEKLFVLFIAAVLFVPLQQPVSAQTPSNSDSLHHILAQIKAKSSDSTVQKLLADLDSVLQPGTPDDTVATRLLEFEELLFKTQAINKKLLLSYTQSVVNWIRQRQICPRTLACGLVALANKYNTMGDFGHSGPLYEEALTLIKDKYGEGHTDYADIFIVYGIYLTDAGFYDKALAAYERAEESYQKRGLENIVYAFLLSNKALLHLEFNQYEKALPAFKKSQEIFKRENLEETADYASLLGNLAKLYSEMGYYQDALPLYEKVIAIDKKIFPEETPDMAMSIYSYGYLLNLMGRFEKALPKYQQALSIIEKEIGKNNDQYAVMLDNLGKLYENFGQYTKAESYVQEALLIKDSVLGQEHISYAKSLNNLASIYTKTGEYQKAVPRYQQALRISRKLFGEKHTSYASALDNLGTVYACIRLYAKAIPLFDSAARIRKELLGENHPDYAISLRSLGNAYAQTGREADALGLYSRALEIQKKALGDSHPEYANTLNSMGLTYSSINDDEKALDCLSRSFQIHLQNISANFTTLSEDEKLKLFFSETPKFHSLPSVLFRSKKPQQHALQQLYSGELILKGMVLQDQRSVLSTIRKSNDSIGLQQYAQWKFLRRLIGKQTLLPAEKRRADLDGLNNAVSMLEQNLSRNSAAFRQQQQIKSLGAGSISQKLSAGEAAIEFIHFNLYHKKGKDSTLYAALVVFPVDSEVRFVPLFEEEQLLSILKTPSGSNSGIFTLYPEDVANKGGGSALYNLIWKPLEKQLSGVQKVYYAPTGLLHRIAFGALRKNNKLVLIDDIQLNQVISTRYIETSTPREKTPILAMLWGDIEFSPTLPSGPARGIAPRQLPDTSFNLYTNDTRGSRNGAKWAPLPQTRREVEDIRGIFAQTGNKAAVLKGAAASEATFKALDGHGPSVLHLATHGFFLPLTAPDTTTGLPSTNDYNTFTVQQNPMFRSGLVLAGANGVWSGQNAQPEGEDGILTADEISQMDLSSTDLVVLSACETALGDLQGNEGVIGLQRAFKMAGVKEVMVSLWRVQDKETSELMKLFYENWLGGLPTREALRKAQLTMRKDYPPFYWAGFVMVE